MAVATQAQRRSVWCEEIDGVLYPYTEEVPVVQSNWHVDAILAAVFMLRALLRDRPTAVAFTDIFVYWERGTPRKKIAPDVLVLPVVEHPERERKALYLWRERSRPNFVMEFLSQSSQEEDLESKMALYQDVLRIPEYFICDPVQPMELFGMRLVDGAYVEVAPNEDGRLWSEQLRGWLGTDDLGRIQVWDAEGQAIPRYEEALAEREAALHLAQEERRRREAAEARVRELEDALRRRS